MDEGFLNKGMHLNLNATFLADQATIPPMFSGASIANIASPAGSYGGSDGSIA